MHTSTASRQALYSWGGAIPITGRQETARENLVDKIHIEHERVVDEVRRPDGSRSRIETTTTKIDLPVQGQNLDDVMDRCTGLLVSVGGNPANPYEQNLLQPGTLRQSEIAVRSEQSMLPVLLRLEWQAFLGMKAALLSKYSGQFVAIKGVSVVAVAPTRQEVLQEAVKKIGRCPVLVEHVIEERFSREARVVEMPSPILP